MTSYLLAGPAGEPLTLAETKAYLRLDDDAEDALVATLITAARLHVEGVTGRALMAQSWRLVLDNWPETGMVNLPVAPLVSLTTITAYDADGAGHDISLAQFMPETAVAPARLMLPRMVTGMPVLRERMGIEIEYVAGFGTEAEDVPADIRQALLRLVAYWFEHRDVVIVAGSGAIVPPGFDQLLTPYRQVQL